MAQPAHPHPSLQTLSSAARAPDPRTRRAAATSPPAAHRAARRRSAPPRSPRPQRRPPAAAAPPRAPPPARARRTQQQRRPLQRRAPSPSPWPARLAVRDWEGRRAATGAEAGAAAQADGGGRTQPRAVARRPVRARQKGGQAPPVVIRGGHADAAGGGAGAARAPADELAAGPGRGVGGWEAAGAGWMGFLP